MASIDVGNLNYHEVKGFVNLPFSDTVSTAFTVSKTDRDGYVPNIITGNDLNERDVLAYRAQLRIEASDQLEINASFDGLNSEGLILIGDPVTDMLALQPVQIAPEMGVVGFNFDPSDERDVYGAHLDLAYELGELPLVRQLAPHSTTTGERQRARRFRHTPPAAGAAAPARTPPPGRGAGGGLG